jgi:hypothetical protein
VFVVAMDPRAVPTVNPIQLQTVRSNPLFSFQFVQIHQFDIPSHLVLPMYLFIFIFFSLCFILQFTNSHFLFSLNYFQTAISVVSGQRLVIVKLVLNTAFEPEWTVQNSVGLRTAISQIVNVDVSRVQLVSIEGVNTILATIGYVI